MDYSQHRHPDRHSNRRGVSQMEHHGSRSGYRSYDPQNMFEEGRHSGESTRHNDSRSRRSRKISFNDSISELYDVLSDALRFYQGFKADFERDTQRIIPYAKPDVLDHLWNSKIGKLSRRGSDDRGCRERDDSREVSRYESAVTFTSTANEITAGFRSTVEATRSGSRSEDAENAQNVSNKLGKTYTEIKGLIKAAHYRMRDTKQLMTELEMLLTFLSHNGARQNDREAPRDDHTHEQDREPAYDDQQERDQFDEQGSGDERAGGLL
ncbi:MAG: hypothetical protein Q9195_002435 [Heterodermia aff. obscurata]